MQFSVDQDVFRDIPGLRLATGWILLPRQPTSAEAGDLIGPAWAQAGDTGADPVQSHPQLAPWREIFRGLGLPARDYLPSVEALVRRARRGGPPLRVQPLVDAYNAISLRRLVPVGAFDLDGPQGDIRLGRTRGGEPFLPMGGGAEETALPGELCYLDAGRVLTRHFVWRQSVWGMIRETTRRIFLVAEILPAAAAQAEPVLKDFADLALSVGGEACVRLLTPGDSRFASPF